MIVRGSQTCDLNSTDNTHKCQIKNAICKGWDKLKPNKQLNMFLLGLFLVKKELKYFSYEIMFIIVCISWASNWNNSMNSISSHNISIKFKHQLNPNHSCNIIYQLKYPRTNTIATYYQRNVIVIKFVGNMKCKPIGQRTTVHNPATGQNVPNQLTFSRYALYAWKQGHKNT